MSRPSATNLTSCLHLEYNNINIDMGATFTGAGEIVVPDGSHLAADNGANIGVLLDMQGAFRPGGFDTIGRIDVLDYQQESTGELFVELTGTALNAFNRLVVSGDAVIDGYLNIEIDGAFVPTLDQTINIITSNSRTGSFEFADVSGMPAGLTFHINYSPNVVQLQVVSTPFFSADFDHDGDADATDYAIWKGAFLLNQLGDADGDNDSDAADYMIWRKQFGSSPGAGVGSASAVPEPAALATIMATLAATLSVGFGRCAAR